ncbi:CAP domain-containing protein [Streptomyces narbonensis]|uniref:CAP domain-containing protein n=1 Tax=Streptomyces narbonensis TaxID=67333 RepID=UPI00198DE931|nr:CAP domain-containing protein [Streptomyces narbonensis]GGW03105.1 hypothetical protein GCM10010230_37350 [Streptomyces narbonensis]
MRHHDHPGHPEDPEHVALDGHPDHDGHVVRLDHSVRDGGRHRKSAKGRGSRRRGPRRPGFRAAVTAAGAAAVVLTVAAGWYVAAPAPAAGPSAVAAPETVPDAAGASPGKATPVREAATPSTSPPSTAPAPARSAATSPAARTTPPRPESAQTTKAATQTPGPPSSAGRGQSGHGTEQGRQPGGSTGSGSGSGTDSRSGSGTDSRSGSGSGSGSGTTNTSGTGTEAAGGRVSAYVQEVVGLANAEREKAGCGPLRAESHLRTAAQGHSDDMSARDYYEHDSPEGRSAGDRMTGAGYSWSTWGENIHRGPKTPAEAMADWMDSPGHRENILNCSFEDIGVGVTLTASGPWWVQNFGAKR